MNNTMQVFEFKENTVRAILDDNGSMLFNASDICRSLDIGNVSMACNRLDDDEKLLSTLLIAGQNRDVLMVNESGLYSLIFSSNKPQAKLFRKWVTSEVLPSIRKTGSYSSKTVEQRLSNLESELSALKASPLKQADLLPSLSFQEQAKKVIERYIEKRKDEKLTAYQIALGVREAKPFKNNGGYKAVKATLATMGVLM